MTKIQELELQTLKNLLALWPLKKGKQSFAFHLYRRLPKLFSGSAQTQQNGTHYQLELKDRIQAIFYLTGLYEPETVELCLNHLPTNGKAVLLDVGANVGLMTLQLKSHRPELQCHLFEADPNVFQKLTQNILNSKFQSVLINHRAVSDKDDQTLSFQSSYDPQESGWGRLQNSTNHSRGTSQAVKSVSIDTYLQKNNLSQVDLLKIDVEGAEEMVLKGAERALSVKNIKAVICEMNEEALKSFGSSTKQIHNLMNSFGYRPQANAEMNTLFTP